MEAAELDAAGLLAALLTCPGCGRLGERRLCPCCSRMLCSDCLDSDCRSGPPPVSLAVSAVVQAFAALQSSLQSSLELSTAASAAAQEPAGKKQIGLAVDGTGLPSASSLTQLPELSATSSSAARARDTEESSIASWGLEVRFSPLLGSEAKQVPAAAL